ncbi:hypothetical protein [Subtercola endophyticus]|uniref:hypothetical protein n=1 Tax=Subtercola endophyticus TaxID=2895559 RepID=UPI001E2A43AE|nr:hypothetical protein [Subtercola endophyticus]UFS59475.1 hypothetical protein LQ955_01350 [Subtercola endophyticus]
MTDELEDFWQHTVTVATLQGNGANGAVKADPVPVLGFLDGSRKLVRSATGEQVVSESTFYCPPANAALFLPDSLVTCPDGSVSTVIKANLNDSGGLGLPDHLAVALT